MSPKESLNDLHQSWVVGFVCRTRHELPPIEWAIDPSRQLLFAPMLFFLPRVLCRLLRKKAINSPTKL